MYPPTRQPPGVLVAIPVRNEIDRIGACLGALARQRDAPAFEVVLLLNDCDDGTPDRVAALAPMLPMRLHVIEQRLPPAQAGAGHARRLALARAAHRTPQGVLMTTDADGQVPTDWVALNLRAIAQGADAVAGKAVIDPIEALRIPARLHQDDALECDYAAVLDEIAAWADPDPADPWPRHDEHSGASMAVTAAAWRAVGGIPTVALGEDRAFFQALRRIDARIRHDPAICVTVSGRLDGRAVGGMADTMRRRMIRPDETLDARLESARAAVRKPLARARLRRAWRAGDPADPARPRLARRLGFAPDRLNDLLTTPFFGTLWETVEAESPALRAFRVPAGAVVTETRLARRLLAMLRAPVSRLPADPAATTPRAVPQLV